MHLSAHLQPLLTSHLRAHDAAPRAGFSPLWLFQAGEAGFWYDPSDMSTQFQDSAGTTPVTAAGQPVGKINDKSGRGNHLVQATAASRPTLQQDGSGYWHWLFDGVDDGWAMAGNADFSATDKVTVFAGVYKASDVAAGAVVELTANSSTTPASFGLIAPLTPASDNFQFRSFGTVQATKLRAGFAAPVSAVATGVGDIAGDSCDLRINGVATAPVTTDQGTGNYSSAALNIGRRSGGTLPFNGRIYSLIGRGVTTDAATLTRVERHVGQKMGIAL